MLRYLFKFTIRGFRRTPLFTTVNVIGLTLGMAAFMLIKNYTEYEKSYDSYLPDYENVVRVTRFYDGEHPAHFSNTFAAVGPNVTRELPEVTHFGRLILTDKIYANFALSYYRENLPTITFNHEKAFFADQGIVDLLIHDWIDGDRQRALTDPNRVILAESEASKYFGELNPIGRELRVNGGRSFVVSGVFKDQPKNSHLPLKVLCSMSSLPEEWNLDQEWGWGNFHTYIKITQSENIDQKIHELVSRHVAEDEGLPSYFILEPLSKIHLESQTLHDIGINGNGQSIRFLDIIAWVILFIATINFINFFTARSIERIKEVSLKKIVGSSRSQMLSQFIIEVFCISVASSALALTAIQFLSPVISNLLDIGFFINWPLQLINTATFILLMVVVSFYPAFWLVKRGSLGMIRRLNSPVGGVNLRKMLVLSQFVMTSLLLIATAIIYDQKEYMIGKPSGFEKNQMLIVSLPSTIVEDREHQSSLFQEALNQNSQFGEVGRVAHLPGYEVTRMRWIYRHGQDQNDGSYPQVIAADEGLFLGLKHQLLAGRFFSNSFADDSALILNEQAMSDLGYEDPKDGIGDKIVYEGRDFTLIGVVANYHQESLKSEYNPIAFVNHPRLFRYYTIPIPGGQLQESIELARNYYHDLYPNDHFDHFFLDDYFNRQYQEDIKFSQITGIFSGLAIFIALFGLSGLTLYAINQRIKEISVRKVLGANFRQLLWLFNSSFSRLIVLAFGISTPLAYWLMNEWLTNYSYRISINWSHFIFPMAMVLVLALMITAFIVFRFTHINPTETLRNE